MKQGELTRAHREEDGRLLALALEDLTGLKWQRTMERGGDYVYLRIVDDEFYGLSLDYFWQGHARTGSYRYKVQAINNNRRGDVALGRYQRSTPPEISIKFGTRPEVAARDIQRRFLPSYEKWLQQALDWKQQQEDKGAEVARIAERLVKASGGFLESSGGVNENALRRFYGYAAAGTGEHGLGINVNVTVKPGYSDLELSGLTPQEAVEVVQLIRGFKHGREMNFQDEQRRMTRGPASAESGEVR